jgi:hypothetical protein
VDVQRGVQSVFRAANERLRAHIEKITYRGPRPVLCECSDPGCMKLLHIPPDEYRRVRADGNFVVLNGHESLEIERVVAHHNGYLIVDKNQ